MKKVTILVLLMTMSASGIFGQTSLSLGDIAFVGYNADNPDVFSFILLKDVVTGTEISFTDNGWTGSAFQTGETSITWKSSQVGFVGDIVTITGTSATSGTVTGAALSLVSSGDQIFAYQGALTEVNLITGIQMNGAWDASGSTSSTTSAKPSVFTDGVNSNSISPEVDNAVYQGALTGSASALRNRVNSQVNWVRDNSNRFNLPSDIGPQGGDTTPPSFDSAPAASSITTTGFTLGASIDEGGDIYYVVVADGATAPSVANVIAGTGNGSVAVTSGNATGLSTPFTASLTVSSLSAVTAYDVYVVARDDEGTPNVQAAATKIDVTTSAPSSLLVAATVFLEGAYNGASLNTSINASIPTTQPYSINGHSGGSAGSIPAGAVDWVLVELREAGSAAGATNATRKGSAAGFLMSDGTIKATDGSSNLTINLTGNTGTDYYVVIYHRNHLPIMSANAVSGSTGTLTIDFTTNSANTYQTTTALVALSGSKFGMPAGDSSQDGLINTADLSTWRSNNGGVYSYSGSGVADFNLDGVINAVDRNDFQQKNTSKTRQVPST